MNFRLDLLTADVRRRLRLSDGTALASYGIRPEQEVRFDSLIADTLLETAARLCSTASLETVREFGVLDAPPVWHLRETGDYIGICALPEDFLRLAALRIEGWRGTLHKATTPEERAYALRSARWEALSGSPERPAAYLVPENGRLQLEIHSSRMPDPTIESALYIAAPEITVISISGETVSHLTCPKGLLNQVLAQTADTLSK